jgi:ribosomal protein S18 acetylase RimI-like enzyme
LILQIAEIETSDISEVIALWQRCELTRPWNDPTQDINFAMASTNSTILVGKLEGKIIATTMTGHDGHRGAIYYLAVDPSCQGKGYGRAIHGAAVEWLKEQGVWKINLMTRSENTKVQGFYEKLGYDVNDVKSLGKRI